jgi:hypothetical protein
VATDEPSPERPREARQPYLFDLASCVNAPSLILSSRDGQIREGGVQGWMYADRRMLSRLRLTVGGVEPVGLGDDLPGASGAAFRGVVPGLGDPIDDPTVYVDRRREVGHDALTETVNVTSAAQTDVHVDLAVEAASDFSAMARVRTGRPGPALAAEATDDGLRWEEGGDSLRLTCDPPPDHVDSSTGTMSWSRDLGPGGALTVRLSAQARIVEGPLFRGATAAPWSRPRVRCVDRRVPAVVMQGLDDLEGLLLRDGPDGDLFVAAGSPWFLTLFGRDSLWTARMLLPLGTDLALSTLRALARRQGTRDDPDSEEQPGKILHEVRAEPLVLEHFTLPPTYYGTADATQLFVSCCAEAWRWGADPDAVRGLLPAVERALGWMEAQAGDGFIRYVDTSGHGLANQGWKDSLDSVQWADGRLAEPPISLSEVQAYSYQAAMLGADLLDGFDRPGGDHWRDWAEALAGRFRSSFWVEDDEGPYPAIALDRHGAAVDSVASNMGHLLGTGLLDEAESALVARRLAVSEMDSGFGLRTLTSASPRFSRLSYHGGAVWPHDTAIAASGLCRDGFGLEGGALFCGLVRAAPAFDFRLPELYGGDDAEHVSSPTPYPAACRPQAWSAASPIAALVALLGLEVDVPRGRIAVRPQLPASLLPLSVSGLQVGDHRLDIEVDADGRVGIETDHPTLSSRH